MNFKYFSHNGSLKPATEAVIPLSDVEYSYGFGVYESIRVSKGLPYYLQEHAQRLLDSAKIIELDHEFTADFIQKSARDLVAKNEAETCNVKVLLIGGKTAHEANLYLMCLNPLFPDRKLYKTGTHCITRHYERPFPHAKTLNMLPSYLAFREAKKAGAYDALLINDDGNVVEGTRTNFFVIKDKAIVSPPSEEILLGVTRDKVLQVARDKGFEVIEKDIKLSELNQYDGAFLTSTSSKIMPISSINDQVWEEVPPALKDLMAAFNESLDQGA